MKTLLGLLLLTGCAYAQTTQVKIPGDSLLSDFTITQSLLNKELPEPMPNARPTNSFYRYKMDPKNVMRATLDNMPVKVPDSSVTYIMGQAYKHYRQPAEPPTQFLKPVPRIVPKRFR